MHCAGLRCPGWLQEHWACNTTHALTAGYEASGGPLGRHVMKWRTFKLHHLHFNKHALSRVSRHCSVGMNSIMQDVDSLRCDLCIRPVNTVCILRAHISGLQPHPPGSAAIRLTDSLDADKCFSISARVTQRDNTRLPLRLATKRSLAGVHPRSQYLCSGRRSRP